MKKFTLITLILLVSSGLSYATTPPPPPVNFIDSLVQSGRNVSLKNDTPTPAASMCYSTNASGVIGWFSCSSGGGGSGTVTSVALSDGSTTPIFSISGSPVTTSGTLTFSLLNQMAHQFLAGPVAGGSGTTQFRTLVASDVPTLNQNTTGTAANITATSNSTLTTLSVLSLPASQLTGLGNLTDVGTDGITVGNGAGAVVGTGTTISQHVSDTTHAGYLTSTDWNTFNGKQSTLTLGNLTDVGTDGITVTGGTGAIVGTGTSFAQHVSDTTHNGYLATADWNTFSAKQSALTFSTPLVNTSGTVSITGSNFTDAGTDGITVTGGTGAVLTTASIAQHVSDTTHSGYLATADWNTFNGKQSTLTFTSPLVNTTGTISCNVASGSQAGCLSSASFTTFNAKQSALTFTAPLVNTSGTVTVTGSNFTDVGTDGITVTGGTGAVLSAASIAQQKSDGTHNGYLSSADWTTFSTNSTPTFADSLVNSAGTVTLVNDSASPGNSMCYSTNASGVLGWNACSSGGGGSGTVTSVTAGTGITLSPSPITTTGSVSLTVPVAVTSGGTNLTSNTIIPTATTFASWDANSNLSANNLLNGQLTSAASSITLTAASPNQIIMTNASSSITVKMPVVSTLALGETYWVYWTGNITGPTFSITSSGNNAICSLAHPTSNFLTVAAMLTVIAVTGTTAASWQCLTFGNYTFPMQLDNGGTGVSSVTTSPTASAFAGWDAQKRMSSGVSPNCGFTTTATAAGTTTMSITSTCEQTWTGSTTQTIKLPTTSVKAGDWWEFYNLSTGTLALEASGAGAIVTQAAGAKLKCLALTATPTTAAAWSCL